MPMDLTDHTTIDAAVKTVRDHWELGPALERAARTTITRRLSTPDDVANLVTYFASPANRSVTGELIRAGSSTTRSHHGAFLEA